MSFCNINVAENLLITANYLYDYYSKVVMEIKRCIILLFFLLVVPLSMAEISITLPERDSYNLGEKIMPTVSIKEDQDYNGFFKVRLLCDDFDFEYFTTPLNLEENVRTQMDVPGLGLFESMLGTCRLKTSFNSVNGAKIDTASSNDFSVTDNINIIIDQNLEFEPGEDVIISADIRNSNNEIILEAEAEITFMNNDYELKIVSGRLEHKLELNYDVEAGKYPIKIVVKDGDGNIGEKNIILKVLQIPTKLENQLESKVLFIGESLKTKIVLYDHNANVIKGNKIKIKVNDPDDNTITESTVESSDNFGFYIDNSFVPGEYTILSTYEDIKGKSVFTIMEVKKISMRQEEGIVYIENTGNVYYEDETTIVLENDDKKYLINKKIKLEPQETMTIDLSEEVPQGTYDVILPEDAVETVSEGETVEQLNRIEDITLDDKRSSLKKTVDGVSSITGMVTGTVNYVVSKPILASIILITIILGTLTYYGKGFILERIKSKKVEDTTEIFDDYEYEEEKK